MYTLQQTQMNPSAHERSPRRKYEPPSSFLFTLTQKQISYTAWLPPLICLMRSIWRLPLLTNLQARLVHLGLNTVMGTSCLVNKQACKHKMHCALCIVLPYWFIRARNHEDKSSTTKDYIRTLFTGHSGVYFSKAFSQLTVI